MTDPATGLNPVAEDAEYPRRFSLIVYGTNLNDGLDLSNLRVKFSVKRSDVSTPNVADIRIYNVTQETALSMLINLTPQNVLFGGTKGRVLLSAGYPNNFGVIFRGNIKQVILGRESATDTFVDIIAGDGDRAYNFAVVNTTLAAGSSQSDQLTAVVNNKNGTASKGVTLGHVGQMAPDQLTRGKAMFGNAKNYLRNIAQNTNQTWSIQDEQITFIPVKSYLPGEQVVLTSKTGLVGTPNQTTQGMNIKCMLNPFIKVGGLVNIAEATVADFKINISVKGTAANTPAPQTQDGIYYVMAIEYSGDTRGTEWYSSMICINMKPSTNPLNSNTGNYVIP